MAEKFKVAGVNIQSMHILNRHASYANVALTADDEAKAKALLEDEDVL